MLTVPATSRPSRYCSRRRRGPSRPWPRGQERGLACQAATGERASVHRAVEVIHPVDVGEIDDDPARIIRRAELDRDHRPGEAPWSRHPRLAPRPSWVQYTLLESTAKLDRTSVPTAVTVAMVLAWQSPRHAQAALVALAVVATEAAIAGVLVRSKHWTTARALTGRTAAYAEIACRLDQAARLIAAAAVPWIGVDVNALRAAPHRLDVRGVRVGGNARHGGHLRGLRRTVARVRRRSVRRSAPGPASGGAITVDESTLPEDAVASLPPTEPDEPVIPSGGGGLLVPLQLANATSDKCPGCREGA